jgi:hypothetical protein
MFSIFIIIGVLGGIALGLCGMAFILFAIIPRSLKLIRRRIREIDNRPVQQYEFKSTTGKWYPSGWIYDEKTKQWTQPDYNTNQAKQTPDPRIKLDRTEPTYEEWKAARQKRENPRG